MLKLKKFHKFFQHNSKGFTFIEVIIALALLGIIGVAFLSGLFTASKAILIADERTTAESLARSQMEYVKNCSYEYGATEYDIDPNLTLNGYTLTVAVVPLHAPDNGIQRITVNIYYPDTDPDLVITLEGYKVAR